jgi:hypothetical protein
VGGDLLAVGGGHAVELNLLRSHGDCALHWMLELFDFIPCAMISETQSARSGNEMRLQQCSARFNVPREIWKVMSQLVVPSTAQPIAEESRWPWSSPPRISRKIDEPQSCPAHW